MKQQFLQELIISVILILLLVFFINPYMFWMPDGMTNIMLLVLLVVFSLFASIIWKENPQDEREGLHRMIANRIGYFTGAIVLLIGIVYQTITHSTDPWLATVLGLMILAKIITIVYTKHKI